jgi:anti-anti-sigma regulatory factor
VNQREIARRTAEKIDLIESQMDLAIPARVSKPDAARQGRSDSLPPTPPQRPLPAGIEEGGLVRFPPAQQEAAAGSRLSLVPMNDPSTSVILGDTGAKHSVEVLSSGLLPVFEEASVLYSNGQSNEAAMILWQAIKENQLGQHTEQAWKMLFELYQAAGRRPEFESLAIDYASRFESSPPAWSDDLSPPEVVESRPLAASTIVFPIKLDAQAVKQVEQMQRAAQRNRPAEVDFSKVNSVDAVGADLLLRVLVDFRKNSRQMTLSGVEGLRTALASAIQSGRRDPSDACWLLKLETLRFLGEQQQFEDLAIEYCVTYEVSPPSWEPMPASIRLHNAAAATVSEAPRRPVVSDEAFPLEGEIDGRPEATFKSLRAYSQSHAEVVIDCRRLRRMDFVCAGEMLNEVAALRSAGKFLVFKDLTYLVACLMMVMGIHDLAELNLRTH